MDIIMVTVKWKTLSSIMRYLNLSTRLSGTGDGFRSSLQSCMHAFFNAVEDCNGPFGYIHFPFHYHRMRFGLCGQLYLEFMFLSSHSVSQKLWSPIMMCTWIFAGSVWRGTTCAQSPSRDVGLHTLSVAACTALPGVDSVPSVPGATLVRHAL